MADDVENTSVDDSEVEDTMAVEDDISEMDTSDDYSAETTEREDHALPADKGIDITGDGKVFKVVMKEGEGDCPAFAAKCNISWVGYTPAGRKFVPKKSPYEFDLGKDRVIKGWDEAVKTMKAGEKAVVTVEPEWGADSYRYPIYEFKNKSTKLSIEKDMTLRFELELLSFTPCEEGFEKDSWEMSAVEKIEAAKKRKDRGNHYYKLLNYKEAAHRYDKMVDLLLYMDSEQNLSDEQKVEVAALRTAGQLNLAQSRLKLGEFSDAVKSCTAVLEKDPRNVKALFRRAQGYAGLSEFEKAKADFTLALELEPANEEIQQEHQRFLRKQVEYIKKEKTIYAKMFNAKKKASPLSEMQQGSSAAA